MHACTVESATTSTQHPSPTPSVPSRSLASFQVAVFAPKGGTLSAEFLEFGFRFLFVTGAIGLIHLRVSSDSSCRMLGRPVLCSCTSCYLDPMVRLCTPSLLMQSRFSLPFLTALPVHCTLEITFAVPVICFAFACCISLFVVDFWVSPEVSYTVSHPTVLVHSHPVHFPPMSLRSLCLSCLSFQRSEQSTPFLWLCFCIFPSLPASLLFSSGPPTTRVAVPVRPVSWVSSPLLTSPS